MLRNKHEKKMLLKVTELLIFYLAYTMYIEIEDGQLNIEY